MSPETPPPHLVDAIRASALKLKEKQTALATRAKELDALKARLDQERAELDAQVARTASERKALEQERQGLDDVRASLERDLGAINEAKDQVAKDQESVKRLAKSLEEREKTLKGDEERLARLGQEFTGQMRDSGSNLRGLLERGETFVKLQADWLASVEAREKELRTISEELRSRRAEFVQQHEALVSLKGSLEQELNKMLAEHETLTNKEKSILEAEKYLATALQIEGLEEAEPTAPDAPPPTPAEEPVAPAPSAPTPEPVTAAEPTPQAEPAPEPTPEPVTVTEPQEPIPDPEPKSRPTKAEATERLAKAVEAWKRARDSGWKVTDIRKTVKQARDAVENGEYQRAVQFAAEILEQLQASATAR